VKLVLIIADDAYFWVLNGSVWECYIENGSSPAMRMETWDCWSSSDVDDHIQELIVEHQRNATH
jgi:hypothetical protein